MDLKQLLLSLVVGVIVGGIFSALKLPIPAPRALSGVVGITGVYLGYKLVTFIATNADTIRAALPL